MSHFTLMVVSRTDQLLEEMMQGYDESIVTAPTLKYTKEQAAQAYRKELDDYEKGWIYQEYLKDPEKYAREHSGNQSHLDYLRGFAEMKANISDEDCYKHMADRYNIIDPIDGGLYTTYNPNSKFDYYSVMWDRADTFEDYLVPVPEIRAYHQEWWERFIENKTEGGKDPAADFRLAFLHNAGDPEEYRKAYASKEEFLDTFQYRTAYSVLLPNGIWYEPGQMGWFGCSSQTIESEKAFHRDFRKNFIEPYNDDEHEITLVDCHI